jgi:hypothetical protein
MGSFHKQHPLRLMQSIDWCEQLIGVVTSLVHLREQFTGVTISVT